MARVFLDERTLSVDCAKALAQLMANSTAGRTSLPRSTKPRGEAEAAGVPQASLEFAWVQDASGRRTRFQPAGAAGHRRRPPAARLSSISGDRSRTSEPAARRGSRGALRAIIKMGVAPPRRGAARRRRGARRQIFDLRPSLRQHERRPSRQQFSDGISGSIESLASVGYCAQHGVDKFKGKVTDVKEVAKTLGVYARPRRQRAQAGIRVRITAQLIDAENWADGWAASRLDRHLCHPGRDFQGTLRCAAAETASRRKRRRSVSAHRASKPTIST